MIRSKEDLDRELSFTSCLLLTLMLLVLLFGCSTCPLEPEVPEPAVVALDYSTEVPRWLWGTRNALVVGVPLGWPVEIRMKDLQRRFWGYTQWVEEEERFAIYLNNGFTPEGLGVFWFRSAMRETLVHEWAHCVVWNAAPRRSHGPLWGVAYSKCYEAVMGVD